MGPIENATVMPLQSFTTSVEPIDGTDELFVTIPEPLLLSEDWREGDRISCDVQGHRIVLTNVSKNSRALDLVKFRELDPVIVPIPFPQLKLEAGATGVVVHVLNAGAAYEVEIFNTEGVSVGVETIEADYLRSP